MLKMEKITKTFPGVIALDDITITLKPGEVHSIVGENGAGKSTLMKILNGVYISTSGQMSIDDNVIEPHNTKDAQGYGINIIFQEFSLVPYLNAVENIFLGREITTAIGTLNKGEMRKIAQDTLQRINVVLPLDVPVADLTVAEQQFVEIAKALAFHCKYLILDEPTATLTPKEVDKLFKVMHSLKGENVGCFYISHHLDEVYEISDRISCLRDGKMVGTYAVDEITESELVALMVGRDLEHSYPPKRTINFLEKEIVLDVQKLITDEGKNISFQLHKGEILGMAGLVGSGRTEICRALVGAYPFKEKQVLLNGIEANFTHPSQAIERGMGYLSEDRKKDGLFLDFDIQENVIISSLERLLNSLYFVSYAKSRRHSEDYVKSLKVKTPGIDKIVGELSGGNQQKIIIARWLLTESQLLIFDEPTRGIDVGAKLEIYNMLQELTNIGMSIIVISSDLPEIIGISDRVLVVRQGEIVGNVTGEQINPEIIMQYASGGEK